METKQLTEITFEPWPSIARYSRNCTITEKIDGTNSQIIITEDGRLGCASRTRLITPEQDNFGFATWAYANKEELIKLLGVGRHFGEWWGSGIQIGYGLPKGEKRFSLFNCNRWAELNCTVGGVVIGPVPVIEKDIEFNTYNIETALQKLVLGGSLASPGFMKPEGIVIYHQASKTLFKKTIENDDNGKSYGA